VRILCKGWSLLLLFFPVVWAIDIGVCGISARQSATEVFKAWKDSYQGCCGDAEEE
jgi:hypothetical protein